MRSPRTRIARSSVSIQLVRRLTAVALVAVLASGCEKEPEATPEVARSIKMLDLGAAGAGGKLEYPGQVAAAQHSDMSFEVPGRMTKFPVNEGQVVTAGQILGSLDPRDFQNEVNAQVATRNAARAEYDRMTALYETGAASGSDLDVARRNFEVAVSAVDTARKALEDTKLRAPFAGTVARKLVEDYANVQAKQVVLILQDTSGLEVTIALPERDWITYAKPDPAVTMAQRSEKYDPTVTIASLPDRPIPARFKEVATTADPVTRTYAVTFSFDPPEGLRVMPGMTARITATLPQNETGGFLIPANAVVSDSQSPSFVWVVDSESMRVERRPVEVGDLSGSNIVIRSGLASGDVVAISGTKQLRDDMLVRRITDN